MLYAYLKLIIDSISQFVATNRRSRAIEQPGEVLIFNLYQLLIILNREYESWRHLSVRSMKFSLSNRTRAKPHISYVLLTYTTKIFSKEIDVWNILGCKCIAMMQTYSSTLTSSKKLKQCPASEQYGLDLVTRSHVHELKPTLLR